jgi:hypothetical protein
MVLHPLLKILLPLKILASPVIASLVITCCFLASTAVQAEIWLTDTLYLENNNQLLLKKLQSDNKHPSASSLRLLPEFTLTQGIESEILPLSKITLGSKFDLVKNKDEVKTRAIINEFNISSTIGSYWAFTLGRQKISYAQPDLFNTSLNKNDLRPEPLADLNYSQGLLILYRLGYIEQSLLLNQ